VAACIWQSRRPSANDSRKTVNTVVEPRRSLQIPRRCRRSGKVVVDPETPAHIPGGGSNVLGRGTHSGDLLRFSGNLRQIQRHRDEAPGSVAKSRDAERFPESAENDPEASKRSFQICGEAPGAKAISGDLQKIRALSERHLRIYGNISGSKPIFGKIQKKSGDVAT
jgi:hypothetical protein